LEQLALIVGFDDDIGAQTLGHVQGMSHGHHTRGIDRIHLRDKVQYPGKTVDVLGDVLLADGEAREVRDMLDVIPG
jgi:hypothetical protein